MSRQFPRHVSTAGTPSLGHARLFVAAVGVAVSLFGALHWLGLPALRAALGRAADRSMSVTAHSGAPTRKSTANRGQRTPAAGAQARFVAATGFAKRSHSRANDRSDRGGRVPGAPKAGSPGRGIAPGSGHPPPAGTGAGSGSNESRPQPIPAPPPRSAPPAPPAPLPAAVPLPHIEVPEISTPQVPALPVPTPEVPSAPDAAPSAPSVPLP